MSSDPTLFSAQCDMILTELEVTPASKIDNSKKYLCSLTMLLSKMYGFMGGMIECGNKWAELNFDNDYSRDMRRRYLDYQKNYNEILTVLAYFCENFGKDNELIFDICDNSNDITFIKKIIEETRVNYYKKTNSVKETSFECIDAIIAAFF